MEFELRTSRLLGRCSYCLSQSINTVLYWALFEIGSQKLFAGAGFELQS
jgi:hypothetical protein